MTANRALWKRFFDLVVGGVALIIAAPLIIVIGALVWIRMGRPVLYRQHRAGRYGRPFVIAKFRTMRPGSSREQEEETDASRLTPFGSWLRSTSLDELPELWNVVRGDMSLVGPRPLLLDYLSLYSTWHARRHEVRPGITGWAQVHGRNALNWEARLDMDVWYVDNLSLQLDLRILWMTVRSVLRREGITQPGHATSERFRGSNP